MDLAIEREAEWGLMGSSVGTAKNYLTELAVPLLPKPLSTQRAAREIRNTIREQRFYRRTDLEIDDIARWINPMLRGWLEYFGAFHRSALYVAVMRPLEYVDALLEYVDALLEYVDALLEYVDALLEYVDALPGNADQPECLGDRPEYVDASPRVRQGCCARSIYGERTSRRSPSTSMHSSRLGGVRPRRHASGVMTARPVRAETLAETKPWRARVRALNATESHADLSRSRRTTSDPRRR